MVRGVMVSPLAEGKSAWGLGSTERTSPKLEPMTAAWFWTLSTPAGRGAAMVTAKVTVKVSWPGRVKGSARRIAVSPGVASIGRATGAARGLAKRPGTVISTTCCETPSGELTDRLKLSMVLGSSRVNRSRGPGSVLSLVDRLQSEMTSSSRKRSGSSPSLATEGVEQEEPLPVNPPPEPLTEAEPVGAPMLLLWTKVTTAAVSELLPP